MKVAVIERRVSAAPASTPAASRPRRLVASAYAAHLARRGAEYGVAIDGDVGVDMKRVKARKDEIVRPFEHGVEDWMREP